MRPLATATALGLILSALTQSALAASEFHVIRVQDVAGEQHCAANAYLFRANVTKLGGFNVSPTELERWRVHVQLDAAPPAPLSLEPTYCVNAVNPSITKEATPSRPVRFLVLFDQSLSMRFPEKRGSGRRRYTAATQALREFLNALRVLDSKAQVALAPFASTMTHAATLTDESEFNYVSPDVALQKLNRLAREWESMATQWERVGHSTMAVDVASQRRKIGQNYYCTALYNAVAEAYREIKNQQGKEAKLATPNRRDSGYWYTMLVLSDGVNDLVDNNCRAPQPSGCVNAWDVDRRRLKPEPWDWMWDDDDPNDQPPFLIGKRPSLAEFRNTLNSGVGYQVYTLGFGDGIDEGAAEKLRKLATTASHYLPAPTGEELSSLLNQVAHAEFEVVEVAFWIHAKERIKLTGQMVQLSISDVGDAEPFRIPPVALGDEIKAIPLPWESKTWPCLMSAGPPFADALTVWGYGMVFWALSFIALPRFLFGVARLPRPSVIVLDSPKQEAPPKELEDPPIIVRIKRDR